MAFSKSLIEKVVWLRYRESKTKKEIANNLGISRFKVARIIEEAKRQKIVKFDIHIPDLDRFELQNQIEKKFNLKEVLITPFSEPNQILSELGDLGAEYLLRILKKDLVIGVGFSRTINEVSKFLPNKECVNCEIVQITGGIFSNNLEFKSLINIPAKIGEKLNSPVYHLYAPVIVDNVSTKDAIIEEPTIKNGLDKFKNIDVAFVGIGNLDQECTLCQLEVIDQENIDYLKSEGAIGDINARFFDINGNQIVTEIDDRLIGIQLDTLQKIRRVIAIAGGKEKHQAILGALRGGFIDVLITDNQTAAFLNNQ
jgi:DNA-binding transcriptional regulator LsrR (DeoR family)